MPVKGIKCKMVQVPFPAITLKTSAGGRRANQTAEVLLEARALAARAKSAGAAGAAVGSNGGIVDNMGVTEGSRYLLDRPPSDGQDSVMVALDTGDVKFICVGSDVEASAASSPAAAAVPAASRGTKAAHRQSLLEVDIATLRRAIEEEGDIVPPRARASTAFDDDDEDEGMPPQSMGSASGPKALWVDKYAPRSYADLLSSDTINRDVLRWIKLWDTKARIPFVVCCQAIDQTCSALRCLDAIALQKQQQAPPAAPPASPVCFTLPAVLPQLRGEPNGNVWKDIMMQRVQLRRFSERMAAVMRIWTTVPPLKQKQRPLRLQQHPADRRSGQLALRGAAARGAAAAATVASGANHSTGATRPLEQAPLVALATVGGPMRACCCCVAHRARAKPRWRM